FPSPGTPTLPKTFDWWGGGAEGVRSSKNLKKFLYAVRKNVFFRNRHIHQTFASATSRWSKHAAGG
ncbi:hypothetical protein, partial [Bilophila wadsworthia]|uniref:hypothetical protein n=1 Tax=Bilophila wadsworthia TaxID=35833 RepID=UPI003A849886